MDISVYEEPTPGQLSVGMTLGTEWTGNLYQFEGSPTVGPIDCPGDSLQVTCEILESFSPDDPPKLRTLDVELIGDALVGTLEIDDGLLVEIRAVRE